jgi:hypothetical protein
MGILRRHQDLSGQVPEDVLARARRAGVKSFDWYAGRLDTTEEERVAEATPSERKDLKREAERYREAAQGDRASLMSRMRAIAQRVRLRPAR